MNLKEYLFYKNMSLKEFSLLVDISACHLSSVITGGRRVTPKLLRALERVTDGWVKPHTAFAETKVPEGFPSSAITPLPSLQDNPTKENEALAEKFG